MQSYLIKRKQLLVPERNMFTPKPDLPLGTYRHYKGGEYEVLMLACDEATHEWLVIYTALYDTGAYPKVWARPYGVFVEAVEVDGQKIPRFQKF